MSDIFSLTDHRIERARRLTAAGQLAAAAEQLHALEALPLPPARAEEVQRLLAEGYLRRRRFRKAHAHLRQAIRFAPRCSRYWFLLGLAVASHHRGRTEKALRYYRRSLKLAPNQARCRAEAGLLCVRLGRTEAGLRLLREASRRGRGDAGLVGKLVRGYREAGRPAEARSAVQAARFAAPHCPKLRQLWFDLQASRLCREQETRQAHMDTAPVLLPFLRVAAEPRSDRSALVLNGPACLRLRPRKPVTRRRVT